MQLDPTIYFQGVYFVANDPLYKPMDSMDATAQVTYYGARIRAARAFADLSQEELADALGVDPATIKRRELPAGHDRLQNPKKGEMLAIAQICGVPTEFLEDGFGGLAEADDRLNEIAQRVAGFEDQIRKLRVELGAHDLAVLKRLEEGLPPSQESQPGPPP